MRGTTTAAVVSPTPPPAHLLLRSSPDNATMLGLPEPHHLPVIASIHCLLVKSLILKQRRKVLAYTTVGLQSFPPQLLSFNSWGINLVPHQLLRVVGVDTVYKYVDM